ncbi:MAG: hypothetical protein HY290_08540 [Planctomycetia bacterium]|nr:hypothetical protein [Planctomycetia bacterium]
MNDGSDWLKQGEGRRPHLSWSLKTEAPLVGLQFAKETGETLAADAAGGLYQLDRKGEIISVKHGPAGIRAIAWSDTGNGGIALVGDEKLYWFNRKLLPQGWIEHSELALALALEAHGYCAAVSLADGSTIFYDSDRKRVRRITTPVALVALAFLDSRPALVGVAEQGVMCCYAWTGEQEWKQQLWASVGDLAVTGDGETILLASYSQGIQCHQGGGSLVGSYQLDGTVAHVSTSYRPGHIAATTVERQFFYLSADGQIEFQSPLPDDVIRVICDPRGKGVLLGLAAGRVVRLDWGAEN